MTDAAPEMPARRSFLLIALTGATAVPGVAVELSGAEAGAIGSALVFGLSILSAAFLLAWAAEALQLDVSQGLAIALVALIAVLPEYAVDIAFAVRAGDDPSQTPYAVANMTGANRLLVGVGWPLVFGIFWLRTRKRVLKLDRGHVIEIGVLAIATLFSFTLLWARSITIVHTAVFVATFIVYLTMVARAPVGKPHLVGPSQALGVLSVRRRRLAVAGIIVFAGAVVLLTAEPFAASLVATGIALGIDEFLLVQWVAPFASEAPEFVIACLLALNGYPAAGMGTLISSKVNQWTLLVASLPVAYAIGGGGWGGLPFDARQVEEVFITAAQSLFAVAVVAGLYFSWRAAVMLLALFLVQFALPSPEVRMAVGWIYVGSAVVLAAVYRVRLRMVWRSLRELQAKVMNAEGRRG